MTSYYLFIEKGKISDQLKLKGSEQYIEKAATKLHTAGYNVKVYSSNQLLDDDTTPLLHFI